MEKLILIELTILAFAPGCAIIGIIWLARRVNKLEGALGALLQNKVNVIVKSQAEEPFEEFRGK